jgi:hypothetical protein
MPSIFRGSDGFDTAGGNAVRAWVNFNGTGTVAIRASFNVSSITDNGTGDYTVNFTTALPDANYAAATAGSNQSANINLWIVKPAIQTTSSIRLLNLTAANVLNDVEQINVAIFR